MTVRRTTAAALAAMLLAAGPQAQAQRQPRAPFAPSHLLPVDAVWETTLDGSPRHAPAFDRERAYVALRDDRLIALDLATGEPVWSVEQRLDHPPVAGDGVVAGASGNRLDGRRASDGAALWHAEFESPIAAPPLWNTGWLVVATETGDVAALRGFDGRQMWRRALGGQPTVRPAIAGDRVFVSLADGRITVLALSTGAAIWEREITGRPQGVLALDALYVGSTDNHLYRLGLADGGVDWYWRAGGDVVGAPVADLERVYFIARDNVLYALDRGNGARRWRRPLPGRPTDGPLRVGPLLVVAGVAPTVDLFDAETGLPRGNYAASGELAAAPHVVPAARPPLPSIVLVTGAGRVVGLAAAAGPPRLPFGLPPEPFLPRPAVFSLSDVVDWFPPREPGGPAAAPASLPLSAVVDWLPPRPPPGLPASRR